MERTVNITSNQKVTQADFNNFGAFPRASIDNVVRDLGGYPGPRYTGLLVAQVGQSTVSVGSGRFHRGDGAVFGFYPDGAQTIDLLDHLPAVAKRIATIVAWGASIDTALQPRTRLINVDTRETEGFEHLTENRRQGNVNFVLGQENATPQPPSIQSDYVAVAHVVLTPAGIESIEQLTQNRLGSVRANAEQIGQIDARLAAVGPQIDTLKTDISGLADDLSSKVSAGAFFDLARDVARVKDISGLPDDYAAWGADLYLTDDESDTDHPSFNARIDDGLRFPAAGQAETHIALENPSEPRVTVTSNLAVPSFTSQVRTSVVGRDAEYPLTNSTIETVDITESVETRGTARVLGRERISQSSGIWDQMTYLGGQFFKRSTGETYALSKTNAGILNAYLDGKAQVAVESLRFTQVEMVSVSRPYLSQDIVTETIAGSMAAQIILNSQDGFMTGLDLFFTRKASSGAVRVLITEVDASANPDMRRVLVQASIPAENINIYPAETQVSFKPVFMQKGKRYAIVLSSSNAHFVAQVSGNKFAQGVMKFRNDGVWTAGDADTDLAFRTRFAVFDSPIVTVQLAPLELAGGIDSIAINADRVQPDGTRIEYEIRVDGVWRNLVSEAAAGVNLLAARPSLVQFRAVLIGTTDVMPVLGLGPTRSKITLTRPGGTGLFHVSTERTMPAPVDQVEVRLRADNWDNDEHSLTVALLTGASFATELAADSVISAPARGDPNVRDIRAVFDVTALEAYKIKITGNIGSSAEHYHVAERVDLAFT